MTLVREFNLYLTAGRTIPLVINVNQFDSGEQWAFTIYKEDGTQYIPSTGAIVGIKSDNLGIINSGTVDENGRVIITETQQMTASVGKAVFELTLDSGTHGTANFVVLVEPKPGNNADLSDSDISLIQEALNAVSPLPTGGTVGQVLTKTAQGSAWSDAGTPTQEQVAEAVSDWADEHITVETGVVIDTSLSVAGAAADAKKTGDEISDLKSAFDNLVENDLIASTVDAEWAQNRAMISDGVLTEVVSSNFCNSGFVQMTGNAVISIASGYKIYAWKGAYNEFGHAVTQITSAWTEDSLAYTYDSEKPYLTICVMIANNVTITPEQAESAVTIGQLAPSIFALKSTVNSINNNVNALNVSVPRIQNMAYSKNLIGTVRGTLYATPFIHTGDKLTFSTKSGNAPTSDTNIRFYDEDKTYLGAFPYNASEGASKTITIPAVLNGSRYISFTTDAGDLQVEFGSAKTAFEEHFTNVLELNDELTDFEGKVISESIPFDTSTWDTGYYTVSNNDVTVVESASYKHAKLPIFSGSTMLMTHACGAVGYACHFLDSSDNYISSVRVDSYGQVLDTMRITAPYRKAYICVTITASTSDFSIVYAKKPYYDEAENQEVGRWLVAGASYVNFAQTAKPILTFTDDDTVSVAAVKAFHDVLSAEGITGSYAVMASNFANNAELKDLLLSYELEGFHMAYHCNVQSSIYENNGNRDLDAVKADFITGLRAMQSAGFVDYKQWISPYGSHDTDLQNLAKKWGMECLVSIGQKTYNNMTKDDSRFFIKRIGLNSLDSLGSATLQELKDAMLSASIYNGWVLVGTHFADGTWAANDPTYSRVTEIIQYAKSLGFEIMTLNEAYRNREHAYKMWECFGG